MEDDQQFCLRWNNHQSTLISVFDTLLENQTLVDCTLAAEGKFLKAHKVVLSACSPFFATLLQQQYDKHPIFILKDVKYQELRAMMDYMYRGEVNISQDQLAALLKAAESLQIKGLSDNRSGNTQKTEQHRGLNVPGSGNGGGKLSGYTLEQTQTKRPRVGPSSMETTDLSGSREGSSSPSRRRRKVRRRSVENAMPADIHDNSNSSQINQSSLLPQQPQQQLQQQQQQPQSTASLTGIGAITAAALPAPVSALPTGSSGVLAATGSIVSTQGTTQQMTPSITKKTESVKGVSDAINTENIQAVGAIGAVDEQQNLEHAKGEKSNHKQKSSSTTGIAAKETADMVIEPKSEYDEEGNEETVEDLTLDDEEMGMDDLDQNAGTSQAGEGSSQGYAPWQHDRSQDELLLAPQEAQQRDPQGGVVKATSKCAKKSTSQPSTSTPNVYSAEAQTQSQCESRIRVRDWLMLADQSVLRKTNDPNPDKSLTTTINTATNTVTNAAAGDDLNTTNTPLSATASTAILSLCSNANFVTSNISTTTTTTAATTIPKQPTLMRIGSIGRTTITCVAAPVMSGDERDINLINNGNMGVISAADLVAAGVELESVDESMTEVLVKIENLSSSNQDEDEDMEEEEGDEDDDDDDAGDIDSNGMTKKQHNQRSNEKEVEFNYDLKLSSPMSWAFDTVKIENEEEFEDILSGENDTTNTEDDDDLLTTAAATTKQAAVSSTEQIPTTTTLSNATATDTATMTSNATIAGTTTTIQQTTGCNVVYKIQQNQQQANTTIRRRQLAPAERKDNNTHLPTKQTQQQQLLFEQQQHLQHLQLQPTQQILHFKLASIPATITSVTTTTTTAPGPPPPPLAPPSSSSAAATLVLNVDNKNCIFNQNCTNNTIGGSGGDVVSPMHLNTENTNKNSDFKSSLSDDKKYRILVQNQRMRKESLEHSEDMIYNADIEKPWVCRNCNRNYKWKNSLKCHLKNECGQPPRYFCSKLCGYATNVHSNLKRHLNTKCRDRIEEEQKNETSTYTLVFQQNE